jgi:hypothetical protein
VTLLAECHYFGGDLGPGELAGRMERFARDLTDRVIYMLDGGNMASHLLHPKGGLAWSNPAAGSSKQIRAPALATDSYPSLRQKGSSPTNPAGLELYVKSSDTTYGRVCVVRGDDPDKGQVISLIPGVEGTDDHGTVSAPLGNLVLVAKAGSAVVVNEASADIDFRVESDGDANNLFSDGGNNRVGIGTGSPSVKLDVNGAAKIGGALEIDGDINHDGEGFGIYGTAPAAQDTGWSAVAASTVKTLDTTGALTLQNTSDCLATLIIALKSYGVLGA